MKCFMCLADQTPAHGAVTSAWRICLNGMAGYLLCCKCYDPKYWPAWYQRLPIYIDHMGVESSRVLTPPPPPPPPPVVMMIPPVFPAKKKLIIPNLDELDLGRSFKKKDDRYPHACPKCRGPAYIGFNVVECKAACR